MKNTAKKYHIEKTNGQFWTGSRWGVEQAAKAFDRSDLIDIDDGDKCDVMSYFDNSIGEDVVIGWADGDDVIALAIEEK